MHVVWVLIAVVRVGSGLDTALVAVNPMDTTQVAPIYSMGPRYKEVEVGLYEDEAGCSKASYNFMMAHVSQLRSNGLRCVPRQVE